LHKNAIMGVQNLKFGKCEDIDIPFMATSFKLNKITAENKNKIVHAILITCNGDAPLKFFNDLKMPADRNLFYFDGVFTTSYKLPLKRSITEQIIIVCFGVEFYHGVTKEQMDDWLKSNIVVVNYDFLPQGA
jgi:hypothetical protein